MTWHDDYDAHDAKMMTKTNKHGLEGERHTWDVTEEKTTRSPGHGSGATSPASGTRHATRLAEGIRPRFWSCWINASSTSDPIHGCSGRGEGALYGGGARWRFTSLGIAAARTSKPGTYEGDESSEERNGKEEEGEASRARSVASEERLVSLRGGAYLNAKVEIEGGMGINCAAPTI